MRGGDEEEILEAETDASYTVEEIRESERSLTWGAHAKGKDYINHYSRIKTRYKRLAFTWMAALFIGLGFVALHQEAGFELNKMYLVVFLTALCWVGIRSLRYVDIHVDHRQMSGIFSGLVELEKRPSALSKPYTKMAKALHKEWFDPVMLDACYYGVASLGVGLLGLLILYLRFDQDRHPLLGVMVCVSALIVLIGWEAWSVFRSVAHGASRAKKSKANDARE